MHGTTDFSLPPHRLLPYASLLWWPGAIPVTPLFLCASTLHFSRDVGTRLSGLMHAFFVTLALLGQSDVAFLVFSAYFCIVHTPLHYARVLQDKRPLTTPLAASAMLGLFMTVYATSHQPLPHQIVLGDWMQKLVISHVACESVWDVWDVYGLKKD